MNGKTIEVNNTDAEGRLILADALCLRRRAGRRADGGPGHADRRDPGRARATPTPGCSRTTTTGSPRSTPPATRPASSAGGCRCTPSTCELDQGPVADLTNAAERARPARTTPPSSCASSSATARGCTSTSPAPPGALRRNYVGKGARGFGTRMLIELAAAAPDGFTGSRAVSRCVTWVTQRFYGLDRFGGYFRGVSRKPALFARQGR